MTHTADTQRATCAVCGQNRAVNKDGTIRHHDGDWWVAGKATTCKGTGQPPATEEPK